MAQFRVRKVFVDIVEADSKEDAEAKFDYGDADEDFVLDVLELDDDGNDIEEN